MAKDATLTITRDLAIEIVGTIEALAEVADRHQDGLSVGELNTLLGARDIAAAVAELLWGVSGSGPEGRL